MSFLRGLGVYFIIGNWIRKIMNGLNVYEYIGAVGVALVAVVVVAVYLCVKYVIYFSWIGWVFCWHIAAL